MSIQSAVTGFNVANANLDRLVQLAAERPEAAREIEFFRENIGSIESADDLFANNTTAFRLRNFLFEAFGLQERAGQTALLRDAFSEPVSFGPGLPNPENIANRLNDGALLAAARTLDLGGRGAAATSDPAVVDEVIRQFVSQSFINNQSQQNPGVGLAFQFLQVVDGLDSGVDILANQQVLEFVRLGLGLAPQAAQGNIETLARFFEDRLGFDEETRTFADFQEPELTRFINRALIQFDQENNTNVDPVVGLVTPLNSGPGQLPPIVSFAPAALEAVLTGGATPLGFGSGGGGVGGLF